MTATSALTTDLQRQVLLLEDDLRARVAADADLEGRWKQEHQRALDKERTAASWVAWRDDRVTQAAVAWVLTSVFIRFCEDNALVAPVWIAGPESRRQEALDAQLAFFRAHPEDTDRDGCKPRLATSRVFPRRRRWSIRIPRCTSSRRPVTRSRRCSTSGDAGARTARSCTTWPIVRCPPASSATCTRTCPSTPRTPTRCCRPRSSSRSSSSTAPSNRR